MGKIIALDPKSTYQYILKSQREDKSEDQIVWNLRHLTAREESFIEDKLGSVRDGEYNIKIGTQNRIALDMALESVDNFLDSDGKAVEVKRKTQKMHGLYRELEDSFIDRVPKEVRLELAQQILNVASVEDKEEKN